MRLGPEPEPELEPERTSEFALALLPGVLDVALLARDAASRSPPSTERHPGTLGDVVAWRVVPLRYSFQGGGSH